MQSSAVAHRWTIVEPRDAQPLETCRQRRGRIGQQLLVQLLCSQAIMMGKPGLIALRLAFWAAGFGVAVRSLLRADLLPPTVLFDWWDKAQHALAFAVLSVLGQFAYLMERRLVLVGLTAYGALIEIAQHATGWRYGDVSDWVADLVGIGLGWVLVWAMSEKLGR